MKVSRTWLQKYFDAELPSSEELADALTFHAFEIEEVQGDMLDVKVLPDRACYALSHRGVAKELSAILNIPLKKDPLREALPDYSSSADVTLTIDTPKATRHMAALVRGVKVGPSPAWLKETLESVGQRSINNIVDATNYVTLDIGQPLHAFDAAKIPSHTISIRETLEGETLTTLSGETYTLPEGTMVLSEGRDGAPLDVAGIKGGKDSGTTEATTELLVSVANFDGTSVRRAAQALKLWTDASLRFQNKISPELVAYGMRDVLALITEVAGGEVVGVAECYPNPVGARLPVSTSVEEINRKLGSSFSDAQVKDALTRLGLPFTEEGNILSVAPTFERGDIVIPEDLVEEVGRVLGYENVPPVEPPAPKEEPQQVKYRGIEHVKDLLLARGFTEISTPSFALTGDILLTNPLQEDKPYLRVNLSGNMEEALTRAAAVAPKVLGPMTEVKLFELGTIFTTNGERLSLALGVKTLSGKKPPVLIENADEFGGLLAGNTSHTDEIMEVTLADADLIAFGKGYEPKRVVIGKFEQFSLYPFALRDVAVWTPEGTTEAMVAEIVRTAAGPLLVRLDLFDSFAKAGRTSYAFRLVLEATDHTLADTELTEVMNRVTDALSSTTGFEVR